MASIVFDCTVRPVLIAMGAGAVLRVTGIRRPAARHATWTAVVVIMLAMPLWSAAGLKLSVPVLEPARVAVESALAGDAAANSLAAGSVEADRRGAALPQPPADTGARGVSWGRVLIGVYLVGLAALVMRLLIGARHARTLRCQAQLLDGRLTSDQIASPITIGWVTPAIILPAGWRAWPVARLSAVLQHEHEHARRRDPLVQGLTLVNRAVFWFHPLSWWLERHVAVLAEEACDAAVLATGFSPVEYADSLLEVARSVQVRRFRVRTVGMAMPGGALARRVRQILSGSPAPAASRARLVWATMLCGALTVLCGAADVTRQSPIAPRQAFDVVSVKPCEPNAPSQTRDGGGPPITSPGRLYLQCYPVSTMLTEAYLYFADGRAHRLDAVSTVGVEGAPDWTKSDRFVVEGKTKPDVAPAVMRGPMLQAVLEDRFKLKIRRETRELPIYELVIAKSGAKVSPYTGTDCVIRDFSAWPPVALPAGQVYCGDRSHSDGDRVIREGIATLDELVSLMRFGFDRPLVNRTGITAAVSYRFEYPYTRDSAADDVRASIVAALKSQLGLDVRESKGPRDFLVIDHVERPTPN